MSIPRNDMRQSMHDMKPVCHESKAMGAVPYPCRKDKQACKCAQGKPVVFYQETDSDFIAIGHGAFIKPLNHYSPLVSNIKYVLTSKVVEYDSDTGQFETENTVYRVKK